MGGSDGCSVPYCLCDRFRGLIGLSLGQGGQVEHPIGPLGVQARRHVRGKVENVSVNE